jgi:hypothetical protein
MREILGVAQEEPTRRRWFHDEYFDLFVWQTASGEVTSFQLCYGIDASDRALVWRKDSGFFHDDVRGGDAEFEEIIGVQSTPDDPQGTGSGKPLFERAARTLPEEIRAAVAARIHEYSGEKRPAGSRRKRFRRASWQQPKHEAG